MLDMKRKQKVRDVSLIEDECLACLGFFAYRTGRAERKDLVEAFALSTRLDEPTKGDREGWWKFKFDNIHFAFKQMEGSDVRGRRLSETTKGGAESSRGVQQNIREHALKYFMHDFSRCVEMAREALDAPLPAPLEQAVFEATEGLPATSYLSPGDVQALEGSSPEGVRKLRQHWYLERDSSLPKKAKQAFIEKHGELFCEVCGLRPMPTYGCPLVDAHHRLPLSRYAAAGKIETAPADFAILCPSCHRAVHKQLDCDIEAVRTSMPGGKVVFRHGI
jgi:hypothetical protein